MESPKELPARELWPITAIAPVLRQFLHGGIASGRERDLRLWRIEERAETIHQVQARMARIRSRKIG